MKKPLSWSELVLVMLLAVTPAMAATSSVVNQTDFTFTPCEGLSDPAITVISDVIFDDQTNLYTYTYQVKNTTNDMYVDLFEVPLFDGVDTQFISSTLSDNGDYGGDPGVIPIGWGVADPAFNVTALFIWPMITPGQDSVTLFFQSMYGPGLEPVKGLIKAQNIDREFICLCGDVWSPSVPEPMTVSLLALGAGFVIRRRKN